MKTLIVGDIHGCLNEFKQLLDKVKPDITYSVGDLIDRGPLSYETVVFCRDNNIKACLGNHELMFIEAIGHYLADNDRTSLKFTDWYCNGGDTVFAKATKSQLQEMYDYFKTLPVGYVLESTLYNKPIIVSHSMITQYIEGTLDTGPIEITDQQIILPLVWNRDTIPNKSSKYHNVYGHTPTDYAYNLSGTPFQSKYVTNLDTGCAYDTPTRGVLTGLVLPQNQFHQIRRQHVNENIS